ncbi:MAG: hypothetical protein M5U34_20245 [Chloroflexi bacterium]|nr:hypothetical protein [Chloroflexota bacterium]
MPQPSNISINELNSDIQDDLENSLQLPSLNIIKGYVALHGGHILLDNQANSFTFTICLPVSQP